MCHTRSWRCSTVPHRERRRPTHSSRRAGSRRWYETHRRDPYVKGAASEGYRSRAAYKLIELDRRDRLLRAGAVVLDLGAAPGSWSQVAAQGVGPRGAVLAVDRLPMPPLAGVEVVCGDFTDPGLRAALAARLAGGADLVLSDMAPNLCGIRDVDEAAWLELAEHALELAAAVLKPHGAFVIKAFQGPAAQTLKEAMAQRLGPVQTRKPAASRDRSRELYFLARAGG